MRKLVLSLSAALLITGTMAPTILKADEATNYDVAVELARAKAVDALVERINSLNDRTKQYILNTGDITPTLEEIDAYYGITDPSVWSNYDGGILTVSLKNNSQVEIGNVFTNTPTDTIKDLYLNNQNLDPLASIDPDNISVIDIPLDTVTFNFVRVVNDLQDKVTISPTQPTDTSKLWYKPDGKGGFVVYRYADGIWQTIGTTTTSATGSTDGNIVVKSVDELDLLPATTGMVAMVSDGESVTPYIFDGDKWLPQGADATGTLFNGTATIEDMATSLFSKAGGSQATATAPDGEWAGSMNFTKKDDAATGGYWLSSDGHYVVTSKINNLTLLDAFFPVGEIAWIANPDGGILKLQKLITPDGVIAWVYIAKTYADVLNYRNAPIDGNNGLYVYVVNHSEFYKKGTNEYVPVGTATKYISWGDRSTFSPVTNGYAYLTSINDCDVYTCNGDASTNYYAGAKIDNLYSFYYTTLGKQKNNLTDAKPYTDWNALWTDLPTVAMWNGSDIGEVKNGDILLKVDLNGQPAYKDLRTNAIVNKANALNIPDNVLPSGMYATTVSLVAYNGKNYVVADDLDKFATSTSLPAGYTIYLKGSGLTKYLQECSLNNNIGVWSDNCSDIAHATVAISNGSRSNIPAPANSTRINLTKILGSEPRYTTNGVTYSADPDWYQWFYSTTGTITNNMLDAIPVPANDGTAEFDDEWAKLNISDTLPIITLDGKVYAGGFNEYINNHTKYCLVTVTSKSNSSVYYVGGTECWKVYPTTVSNTYIKSGSTYTYANQQITFRDLTTTSPVVRYCTTGSYSSLSVGTSGSVYDGSTCHLGYSYYNLCYKTASCATTGTSTWYK